VWLSVGRTWAESDDAPHELYDCHTGTTVGYVPYEGVRSAYSGTPDLDTPLPSLKRGCARFEASPRAPLSNTTDVYDAPYFIVDRASDRLSSAPLELMSCDSSRALRLAGADAGWAQLSAGLVTWAAAGPGVIRAYRIATHRFYRGVWRTRAPRRRHGAEPPGSCCTQPAAWWSGRCSTETALGPARARPRRSRCTQRESPRASGRGGIRTPETGFARLTVFKTAAFNRSATLPRGPQMLRARGQALDLARESPGEVAEWLKALAC
jgi:hypothetical protein